MSIGVILALGSGLLFAAGNLVQKKAVGRLVSFSVRAPFATLAAVGTSWIWLLGTFLSGLGVVAQLAAYRRISIAAVQAICAFGVIALLIAARAILRETLTRREQLGALAALLSLALIITSMSSGQSSAMIRLATAKTEIAIGATTLFSVLVLVALELLNRSGGAVFGVGSGLLYGATGLGVRGASAAFSSSGTLGGIERLMSGPIPYSIALTWIAALLMFQMGLQRSRISIVAPLSTVISTVFIVAIGTPLFGEGWPNSGLRAALRVAGLIVILVAVVLALAPEMESGSTSFPSELRHAGGRRSRMKSTGAHANDMVVEDSSL